MNSGDLIDFFRAIHPKTKCYTWRRQNPIKQARLDYFIGSRTLLDLITKCNISARYRSDHSSIELILKLSEFKRGKGIWKFNCSLLKDKEYLDLINKTIKDETVKYAAKVYNMEKIDQISFENIHLTIEDRLFLETLLLEIRGTTIQYSTRLKKEQTNEEPKLIGEIEQLESQENDNLTALTEKKEKLEFLRNEKLNGVLVRSRANWLKNGEKPSKYLCSLERKNYVEKTIKQLKTVNDSITTDQKEILKEIQTYYSNRFKSRNTDETPISSIIDDKNIRKLDDNTSKQLDGKLTAEEISYAIKNMKNDKSPGIGGFPVEFFKIFWGRIKFLVLRALNEGYEKGEMSETLKYAVITCIPKGTKKVLSGLVVSKFGI